VGRLALGDFGVPLFNEILETKETLKTCFDEKREPSTKI
jgi:hypothetical protein